MTKATTLMVQGTCSDAGKSTIVAGLCRCLVRRGIRVAPFKPQNMALNSSVTVDGGEIGRSQAVQAMACNVPPHTDMNPVLLKPNSDTGAQVIIHGHAVGNMNAKQFHQYKKVAMGAVMESHQRLASQYDVIIVEGAGSPAEINLRDNDIANMGFAEGVDCPVIIVADIDRGGMFAQAVGTLQILEKTEEERVAGFIINRFRGDISLLTPGIDWLREYTGKSVYGVLPYLHGLHIEAEDALPRAIEEGSQNKYRIKFRIVVPILPHISNHTDFDPLRLNPDIELIFVSLHDAIPAADLIILPGSKNVRTDLEWLRTRGWEQALQRHLRYSGKIIGICGGYQMLGKEIHDPLGIEGEKGSSKGFGLLDVTTTLQKNKSLENVSGELFLDNAGIKGYEIHVGETDHVRDSANWVIKLSNGRQDGQIGEDNNIFGTYIHGLFESGAACDAILRWSGMKNVRPINYESKRQQGIDDIADIIEANLDTKEIFNLLGLKDDRSVSQFPGARK